QRGRFLLRALSYFCDRRRTRPSGSPWTSRQNHRREHLAGAIEMESAGLDLVQAWRAMLSSRPSTKVWTLGEGEVGGYESWSEDIRRVTAACGRCGGGLHVRCWAGVWGRSVRSGQRRFPG